MTVKTNRDSLMGQVVVGKVAPPTLAGGDAWSTYVTTWDGRPKLGLGPGGVKFNVRVGDPCLGWPACEYLEAGVALLGVDEKPDASSYIMSGTGAAFVRLSCVGNAATVVSGDAKGARGVVTGKGGMGHTGLHVQVHLPEESLDRLCTGDKVRVDSLGPGFAVEGWEGQLFNMSPLLFDALKPKLSRGVLELPVAKVIPTHAMGYGVGGGSAEAGTWCIQSNPPEFVEELGVGDLRFGDLVALQDSLMEYGKGFYRGAVTVGVVTTGGSEQAGQGPGVLALAASIKGLIKPRVSKDANLRKLLKLEAPQ